MAVLNNQKVPETQSFTDRSWEATATRIHDDRDSTGICVLNNKSTQKTGKVMTEKAEH